MVSSSSRPRSHGRSRIGCLFSLLIVTVLVYYGVGIGGHAYRYLRLLEEMNAQARLARYIDNTIIRARLIQRVDQLELPSEARRFTIRRTARPREITIRTEYQVEVELPFTVYPFSLRPEARAPF